MRVGIYNRWLSTVGGGEQYMAAVALRLALRHEVELITHAPVDLTELHEQLGVDLRGFRLRLVPLDHAYRSLENCTRDYDLFVNCSHLDIFRAHAARNAMLVFFPGPLPPDDPDKGADHVFALSGLFNPAPGWRGVYRWTDGSGRLLLRGLAPGRDHQFEIVLMSARPRPFSPARVRLFVNNQPLGPPRQLPALLPKVLVERIPGAWIRDAQVILRIESDTFPPLAARESPNSPSLGVRLLGVAVSADAADPGLRGRKWRRATTLPGGHSVRANTEEELDHYQLLCGVSQYTQEWIARRWHRPSHVLYPLIPVDAFYPGAKKPQIITVGRFFTGSHNKKHLTLIHAFRALCDSGLTGWTYHLVGHAHPEPEHKEYLRDVRAAAAGYPIEVHADLPFDRLRDLYAESTLYWNGTGLGESEIDFPDAFEHFGITPVEAMASGCVPVSFARAGQPEIIEHGISGMLWNTLDECRALSLELIRDEERCARMAEAARIRSRRFGPEAFDETLDRLIDELLESGCSRLEPQR